MPPIIRVKPKTEQTYDNSHWTRGEVRYAPADGRKAIMAPALLFGPWAVVRDEKNGKYDLIHVRTDTPGVLDLVEEKDACRVGDWLWKQFPLVFRLTNKDEMRERLGTKITALNQWTKSCTAAGKFLPPPTI